jgi:hypothetical protein
MFGCLSVCSTFEVFYGKRVQSEDVSYLGSSLGRISAVNKAVFEMSPIKLRQPSRLLSREEPRILIQLHSISTF